MNDCEHHETAATRPDCGPGSAPAKSTCCDIGPAAAESAGDADSCCEQPARRDWFLWTCLVVASLAYGWAAITGAHDHESVLGVFTGGVFEFFNRMWWGIALGVVFVGLLARVPRELVVEMLGRDAGPAGMLRATIAGVFLDLCSHGILAVGMKLYERGASTGQVMAFLLASPWNSFSLTLILFGLIGVGWTMLFIGLSLVVGIVTGLLFEALEQRGVLPVNPHRELLGERQPLPVLWHEFRDSINISAGGTLQVMKDGFAGSRVVIRWALFGLLLAAAIRALVPTETYLTWFGASFAGLWLTLLAATVIEVCSEGATPIAADLLNRAAAPGNGFTFLMAGVATDYTEIMSIRDTTRSWKIALFLPLLTVPQVMILGYILNQF